MNILSPAPESVKLLEESGVKTVLLLDFDGVFNSFGRSTFPKFAFKFDKREHHPNPHYVDRGGWVSGSRKEPKSYELQWSTELIAGFNELLNDDTIQVVWVTTWREHMKDVLERMELRGAREHLFLPWNSLEGAGTFEQLGKLSAVSDFMSEKSDDLKVVWVDDTLFVKSFLIAGGALEKNFVYDDLVSAMTSGVLTHKDTYSFAPNPKFGIIRDEWSLIRRFAKNESPLDSVNDPHERHFTPMH